MKRSTKLIGLLLVLILLIPVIFLFGNPLSYGLIYIRGNAYLNHAYPDLDVQISNITFDFKHGGWSAHAASPTSRDTHFRIYIDGFGRVKKTYFFQK